MRVFVYSEYDGLCPFLQNNTLDDEEVGTDSFQLCHQWQTLLGALNENRATMVLLYAKTPRSFMQKVRYLNRWHSALPLNVMVQTMSAAHMSRLFAYGVSGFFHTNMIREDLRESLCLVQSGHVVIAAEFRAKIARSINDGLMKGTMIGGQAMLADNLSHLDIASLTDTEKRVMDLLAEEQSTKHIAKMLFLSEGHIKNIISGILQITGLRSRKELAALLRDRFVSRE